MSRKSHAFADGPQKFTFRIERIDDGRFKAGCESYPDVFAFGDTEQQAMTAAKEAIDLAARKDELVTAAPGYKTDRD